MIIVSNPLNLYHNVHEPITLHDNNVKYVESSESIAETKHHQFSSTKSKITRILIFYAIAFGKWITTYLFQLSL